MLLTKEQQALFDDPSISKYLTMNFYSDAPTFIYPENNVYPSFIYPGEQSGVALEMSLTDKNILSGTVVLTESISNSATLKFGSVTANKLVISVDSEIDTKGLFCELLETANNFTIPLFYGVVDSVKRKTTANRDVKTLTCYDVLYSYLDIDITDWYNSLIFPMTIFTLRTKLASTFGIKCEDTVLVNDSLIIDKYELTSKLTARKLLQYICEINGVFANVNRYQKVVFLSLIPFSLLYPNNEFYPSSGKIMVENFNDIVINVGEAHFYLLASTYPSGTYFFSADVEILSGSADYIYIEITSPAGVEWSRSCKIENGKICAELVLDDYLAEILYNEGMAIYAGIISNASSNSAKFSNIFLSQNGGTIQYPGIQSETKNVFTISRYRPSDYGEYRVREISKVEVYDKNSNLLSSYGNGTNIYTIKDNILTSTMSTSVLNQAIKNFYDLTSKITYVPMALTLDAKPYLEVGDTIQFSTGSVAISTFILQRTLMGITKDKFEAKGEEYHNKSYIVESEE